MIAKMKILIKWLIDKIEEIFQKIWENEKKCLADRKAKIIFLNLIIGAPERINKGNGGEENFQRNKVS